MDNQLQAVFIDRDGTIGGDGHFIHPKNFKPYHFSRQALDLLDEYGVRRFAFTNQHRISRGEASVEDFQKEFLSYGFEDAFICPHHAEAGCSCHKPKPGMLQEAARRFHLDMKKCVVIGDVGSTDMLAADEVGAMKVLVLTGWGKQSLDAYRHTWEATEADFVAENLLIAVEWLLGYKVSEDPLEKIQEAFEGEAESLGLETEDDVVDLAKEGKREMREGKKDGS